MKRPDYEFRARMQALADRLRPRTFPKSTAPDIQESIRDEMTGKKKPSRSVVETHSRRRSKQ